MFYYVPMSLRELTGCTTTAISYFETLIIKSDYANMMTKFDLEYFDFDFDTTGARDVYGPTPAAQDVDMIIKRAAKCQLGRHEDTAWRCFVHTPLLLLALENDTWNDKLDIVPW